MSLYTTSRTVNQVMEAIGAFISPFVTPSPIIRGQVNRVPSPSGPFIQLTEILNGHLQVPISEYQPLANTATISGSAVIHVQIDCYGIDSGEWSKTIKSAFSSGWGYDHFPDGIKPLEMSDPIQSPLVTGEQQYEARWTMTAKIQYNPVITLPQEFADVATVEGIIDYQ